MDHQTSPHLSMIYLPLIYLDQDYQEQRGGSQNKELSEGGTTMSLQTRLPRKREATVLRTRGP